MVFYGQLRKLLSFKIVQTLKTIMWTHKYKHMFHVNVEHESKIKQLWGLNLLVYGPSSAGKKALLERIIKDKCTGVFNNKFTFKTFEIEMDLHKKIEHDVCFRQNEHMYEFVLFESSVDKFILRDIIKDYASRLYIGNKVPIIKYIILYNINCISLDAMTMLNTIIHKSDKTCRFILVTSNMSQIPLKIQNTCIRMKVLRPSVHDMQQVLHQIKDKEHVQNVTSEQINTICVKYDCNIEQCITALQLYTMNIESSLKLLLDRIYGKMTSNAKIGDIRDDLYMLLINNIPSRFIVKELCRYFLQHSDKYTLKQLHDIIRVSCLYEHRCIFEERSIYHIEAYVFKMMAVLHDNMRIETIHFRSI